MLTCHIRYVIDPYKIRQFEHYAGLWIPLIKKFGGQHHGCFLPSEGANNIALMLFTFPSLSHYDDYRRRSFEDEECRAAFKYADDTRCIISHERSFFRPLLG